MSMPQLFWVRSQHPPTQWNQRGGRWSGFEKSSKKFKNPSFVYLTPMSIEWLIRSGFLAVVWFGSSPNPSPSSVSKLDRRQTEGLRKRDKLLTGDWEMLGEESQVIWRRGSLVLFHPEWNISGWSWQCFRFWTIFGLVENESKQGARMFTNVGIF